MAERVKSRLVVVGALIARGGRLLIAQRPSRGSFADHWEFPGGKTEPGEDDATALAREIREELGARVAVGDLYDRAVHDYPEFTIDFRVYRCALLEGDEPAPLQAQDLRWVLPSEVGDYRFPPADQPVLDRLIAEGLPPEPVRG